MKDFDEARQARLERDRSFRIGGSEFTYRAAVAPERILRWSDVEAGMEKADAQEWLAVVDETIVAILEPGQEDKWAAVRDPDAENPITVGDLQALLEWLMEEVVSPPTGEPSGSSEQPERTETSSTDGSSSPEAEALTLST